jgi:hypothetical protein
VIGPKLLGALLALAAAIPCASLARPPYAVQVETMRGQIIFFDGRFALQVRDPRGFVDNVQLHEGTVIHPTGLRLRAGMPVAVTGSPRGQLLVATEVDLVVRPRAALPAPSRAAAAAALARYRHHQYVEAQNAARRLAAKLERLYGHHAAHVAVAHKPPVVAPKRIVPKHVAKRPQTSHVAARPPPPHVRHVASRPAPPPIRVTSEPALLWYGWGKL